ncbi:hypothetical protein [Corallococcus sp. M7]
MYRSALFGPLVVCAIWTGSAQASSSTVDLLSPSRCTLAGGRLTRCTIPTQLLTGDEFSTGVPLRTVFTRQMTGNCATQYPLEVTLTPASGAPQKYTFISAAQFAVRAPDQQTLTSIELKDSSGWTPLASFSPDCRLSLDIHWNEVDVDTSEQANAILAQLQADLNTKKAARDNLSYLVEYSAAFDFMKELSTLFLTALTSETMNDLRQQAQSAGPIIFKTSMGCDDTLTAEEKDTLATFYFALGTLGDASDYTNPDGTPKTLRDFLGDEAKPIIDKLAARSAAGAQAQYQSEYTLAAAAVAAAEAKLNLARAQLASWLTP